MPAPTKPNPTHYDTLELSRPATAEQIRRAYRAMARQLHPDVNPRPDAAARFAAVQHAYDVLSDRQARAKYDRTLDEQTAREANGTHGPVPHYSWRNVASEATPPIPGSAGPNQDQPRDRTELDDMYDAFFGGGRG